MNTPTISDAAREAAKLIAGLLKDNCAGDESALSFDEIVQLAIDKATEKLTRENESLKNAIELLERGKYGRTDMAMQILGLQKQVMGLREVLECCDATNPSDWWFNRKRDILSSTPDFSNHKLLHELQSERNKLQQELERIYNACGYSTFRSDVQSCEHLVTQIEEERDQLRTLVERISKQWSSCSQCEHNIDDAREALNHSQSTTQ